MKNGLTLVVLGLPFQTNGGNAQPNFKRHAALLESVLKKMEQLPVRQYETAAEMEAHLASNEEVIMDATGWRILNLQQQ